MHEKILRVFCGPSYPVLMFYVSMDVDLLSCSGNCFAGREKG